MAQPLDIRNPEDVQQELQNPANQAEPSLLAETAYAEEEKQIKILLLKAQLTKFTDDNENRRTFATNIFGVTVIWMFLILIIVYKCGDGTLHLSDPVLITLITTTTANVLGFLIIVFNYLFNKEKST